MSIMLDRERRNFDSAIRQYNRRAERHDPDTDPILLRVADRIRDNWDEICRLDAELPDKRESQ